MATAKEKLTALADAVREKTGETGLLSLDAMTTLIQALEVGGGGLPTGWATGEFVTTDETKGGNFNIEHGMGKMPNFIFIWSTATELVNRQVRCVMKANLGEEYDEEIGYYPPYYNLYMFRDSNSGFGNVSGGNCDYDDNRDTFCVPTASTTYYYPTTTFKWLAIRIEE